MLENVNSPQELMSFLDKNIEFGVIDNKGQRFFDGEEFNYVCNNQWTLRSVNQILKDKIGHCYDQVEVERYWFMKNGYEIKTFWICAYQKGVENSGACHTFLVFLQDEKWHIFEHSDFQNKGIFAFDTLTEALKWEIRNLFKNATKHSAGKLDLCIKEFTSPETGINMNEYLSFVNSFDDFPI